MRRLWITIAAWATVVTGPVAAQVVATNPGPIANGQPAGTPTGPAWMFGTSSFRTAGADLYRMQASDANRLTELSDLYLTPQPAGWRVVFANFGLDPNSRPAGSARELRPGNSNVLDYVVAFTGANGTGTRVALTFGGAGSVVMGDGGFVISDPVPTPWPGGFLRTSISTAMGAARPRGFTSMGQLGEVRRHLATANPSYAAGGSIANVGLAANTTNGYSPVAVLIPWTRQPSVLEIGDSITQQDDLPQLASPRGVVGGVTRGLDDDATTGRFGVGNFGHHGAQMADFMDLAEGRFGLRYALLAHIRTVLNGRQVWPFSVIWSQGLRNDFSSMYYPEGTPPDTAVADMEARATAWWSFLAKTFPGVPIIQSTITPRTVDMTSGRTTLSAQTGNGLGSQSPLQAVNDWIMTRPAGPRSRFSSGLSGGGGRHGRAEMETDAARRLRRGDADRHAGGGDRHFRRRDTSECHGRAQAGGVSGVRARQPEYRDRVAGGVGRQQWRWQLYGQDTLLCRAQGACRRVHGVHLEQRRWNAPRIGSAAGGSRARHRRQAEDRDADRALIRDGTRSIGVPTCPVSRIPAPARPSRGSANPARPMGWNGWATGSSGRNGDRRGHGRRLSCWRAC